MSYSLPIACCFAFMVIAGSSAPSAGQEAPLDKTTADVPLADRDTVASRWTLERFKDDPDVRARLQEDAKLISSQLNQPGIAVGDWLSTTYQSYEDKSATARFSRNKGSWLALRSGLAVKKFGMLAAAPRIIAGDPNTTPPKDSGGDTSHQEPAATYPGSITQAPLQPIVGVKQEQVATALAANAAAQAALDGPLPTDPEQLRFVVESIIRIVRPVIVVCDGATWFTSHSVAYSPKLAPAAKAIAQLSRATGLIVQYQREPDGSLTWLGEIGTGVAVSGRRLVTNMHVLQDAQIAYRHPLTGEWTMPTKRITKVLFPHQYPGCSPAAAKAISAEVTQVLAVGTTPVGATSGADYVVFQLDRDPPDTVRFAANDMSAGGEQLVVIGYPKRPDETKTFLTTAQINAIFGAPDSKVPFIYERLSLGERGSPFGDQPGMFTHDASTWNGNSGSAVLALESGAVVGLQVGGPRTYKDGEGYNLAVDGKLIADTLAKLAP